MCAKRFFNSGRNSRRTAGVSNVSVSHSPPRSLPAWFGEQEHLEQQVDPGMAAGWPWGWGDSWGHSGAHPGLPRLLLHSQRATSRKTRDLSTTPGDKGWGQPLVPPRRGLCSPNPGGSSSFGALGGLGPLGALERGGLGSHRRPRVLRGISRGKSQFQGFDHGGGPKEPLPAPAGDIPLPSPPGKVGNVTGPWDTGGHRQPGGAEGHAAPRQSGV